MPEFEAMVAMRTSLIPTTLGVIAAIGITTSMNDRPASTEIRRMASHDVGRKQVWASVRSVTHRGK